VAGRVVAVVVLTPAGRSLVEHTERILVELRAAEATLARDDLAVEGVLRVGVPFREGPPIMSRALMRVREQFPKVVIRLVATSDQAAPGAVKRGQLDLAIVSHVGVPGRPLAGLRQWDLGSDPLRLCVPDGHRLAGATQCALADLRDERWIIGPNTGIGRLTLALCLAAGFEPELAATVDDIGTALNLVGIGWGITIAPALTPTGRDLNVSRIPVAGMEAERHTTLLVRDGDHLSPAIAAAVAAVLTVSADRLAN